MAVTVSIVALCESNAHAQAAAGDPPPYTGTIKITGSAAGGTQQQNTLGTTDFFAYHHGQHDPDALKAETRLQFDFAYGNAKKPGQSRVTSSAMAYFEALQMIALASLSGNAAATRPADWRPQSWLYAVGSLYHHLAFGLEREQAIGVGVRRSLDAGWSFGADIRYIKQTFDGQDDFSSWGVGLRESYAVSRTLGAAPSLRVLAFSQVFEVVPAFSSRDAVKARGVVNLSLPLVNRFAWDLSFGTDYLGNAAPGSKKWYWKATLAGLSYAFGAP